MNKKILVIAAVALLALIAIPTFAILAVKPKPKILIRLDVPLYGVMGSGDRTFTEDKIIFRNVEWTEGPFDDNLTARIFIWEPKPNPPPSHTPAPGSWPAPQVFEGGTVHAIAHGIRDKYTMVGKWHMDFVVTFKDEQDNPIGGFEFRHDCTGVGLVHAASVNGHGFGVFKGVKVSGVSIVDIYEGMMDPPLEKTIWLEVRSGFDKLPVPMP